jgi:hypothetical protein
VSYLEQIKNSNIWDKRFGLPLVPGLNNPFFYLALITKIYRGLQAVPFFAGTQEYIDGCKKDRGLYHRRPDGTGGVTSHDELIGIAYLDQDAAQGILGYLQMRDGVYNNSGASEEDSGERFNLFRFPWFISYLKARAGFRVGLHSQFFYATHVYLDAKKNQNPLSESPDARLMIWLMNEEMGKYPLCNLAIRYWERVMNKYQKTVSGWFKDHLPNYPIFATLSK